jgi:hypothetical protein
MTLHTGSHSQYDWLTTEDHDELADLMRLCPETVLGKYLAVTAIDGAALEVTEDEKAAGWETRKDIAYSPRISSVSGLPHENRHGWCTGFDEWYLFDTPVNLGERSKGGNIFDSTFEPGRVEIFVGFLGFDFHTSVMKAITDLFWKQMAWIQPESYIADGNLSLRFVSRNEDLFAVVHDALRRTPA